MSTTEMIVIAVAGLIGYLLVNALMSRKDRGDGQGEPGSGMDCDRMLGLTAQAGVEEVHQAYERLIARYAPEKLAALDPGTRVHALQEAQWLQNAYREALRKRGA